MNRALENFDGNSPANVQCIAEVEAHFVCQLPTEYVRFMSASDGGEGFVGDHYLVLWRAGEVVDFNRDYEVQKYAPGLLLFGSNGGGEAFGFDMRSPSGGIVMVPLIGMSLKDAKPIAASFDEFLSTLSSNSALI